MRVTYQYSKTIMQTGTTNTRSTASSTLPPPPPVFLPMLWIVIGVCMLLKHDCIVFLLPNNVKLKVVCFNFFNLIISIDGLKMTNPSLLILHVEMLCVQFCSHIRVAQSMHGSASYLNSVGFF